MTEQKIKAIEYIKYLRFNKRAYPTIKAYLIDMFHKAKYGEFLLYDVKYCLDKSGLFEITNSFPFLEGLFVSSLRAEVMYEAMEKYFEHHILSQIQIILTDHVDELKTQYDGYRIFNQYIKDYILFGIIPSKQECAL